MDYSLIMLEELQKLENLSEDYKGELKFLSKKIRKDFWNTDYNTEKLAKLLHIINGTYEMVFNYIGYFELSCIIEYVKLLAKYCCVICPDLNADYYNQLIDDIHMENGAYDTMIKRIESINNPNFFFMNYNKQDLHVKDFLMVPKYFFSPEIIEKRKPLSDTARRAGWVGCNIVLKQIPEEGRIFIVKNEIEIPQKEIISKVKRTDFIKQYKLDARGWVLDVLNCVNQIEGRDFTLEQMYKFEDVLSKKHPDNNHIKDKIRQKLQILRDKGILEFRGRGHYRKI